MTVSFSDFCTQFNIELPIDLNNEDHRKILDLYELSSGNTIETVYTPDLKLSYVDTYTGEIIATKRVKPIQPYTKPIDQAECVEDLENIFIDNKSFPIKTSICLPEYLINCNKDASKLLLLLCNHILGNNKGFITKRDIVSVITLKKQAQAFRTLENDGVLRRIKTKLPKKYIVYAISPWFGFRGNKWAEDHTKEHWVKTQVKQGDLL